MEKVESFFSSYRQQNLPSKSLLITPREKIADIIYLEKGYIRMYVIAENGEELTMQIFKPKTYIPMMFVLNDEVNNYYFESISPVVIRKAPKEKVIEFLKQNSDVLYDLSARFGRGIIGYLEKTQILLLQDAYKKVVSLLIYLMTNFGEKNANGIAINMAVTHYFISTLLGITRETVSRQMKKLENQQIIQTGEQQLIIKKPEILKEEYTKEMYA